MNLEIIKQQLNVVQMQLNMLASMLDNYQSGTGTGQEEPTFWQPKELDKPTNAETLKKIVSEHRLPKNARSLNIDAIGSIPDFNNKDWPEAVANYLIINDHEKGKKNHRGRQIIGLVKPPVESNILDYGCGEGYTTQYITQLGGYAVGYDLLRHKQWSSFTENRENLTFTTDKKDLEQIVERRGYFDFIIVYDVLDHIVGSDPIDELLFMQKILAPNGYIFIRTHPWTSRTGGHYYESVNKAFLHLAITADEAKQLGIKQEPNLKINKPLATYESMFAKAGYKILGKTVDTAPVERFFTDNEDLMRRIIDLTWSGNIDIDKALKIMSTNSIDFLITKA
jgi:2-polyprenyl-3-methyl-5-hydroxy-6-metoxy-1,4-benzoquinol methylase